MPDPQNPQNANDPYGVQNQGAAGETLDESGAPANPSTGEGIADIASSLETARAEAAQNRDAMLRALADSENIRRRAITDVANAHKYAIETFATNLLAVKD